MTNTLSNTAANSNVSHSPRLRLAWVDLIRAIAFLWIFSDHLSEQLFGSWAFGNPRPNWASLTDQIAQLRPLSGYGLLDIPFNTLRYIGWNGDTGVQLFLILSGFGITWSLLGRQANLPINLKSFYRKRFERVYPEWWAAHLLFAATFFFIGFGFTPFTPRFFLSLLGVRFLTETMYYFSPAWWYVGLQIQLYLIFPLLWNSLRRFGPLRLFVICCAITIVARAIGLLTFGDYIDAWQRGAFFITQLPSFVFGICLAAWLRQNPEGMKRYLTGLPTVALSLAMCVAGFVLSFSLLGMSVAPFLSGIGIFLLLYALLHSVNVSNPQRNLWMWIGEHSYSLYLVHHPLILLFVPATLASTNHVFIGTGAAIVFTLIASVFLERAVSRTISILTYWRTHVGTIQTVLRILAVGVAIFVLLLGSELAVERLSPQEVYGWGERPSLQPDPIVGWNLKPSSETNLRWSTYDYHVTANNLGFPGPHYAETKGPNTFRILTTGDAFTSAEGVDTDAAWPRLLETDLSQQMPDRKVEVANFAITGYGPNQYAAVVDTYGPDYKPDLIISEVFVNDYEDVLIDNEDAQKSIGFGNPSALGLSAILHFSHLVRFSSLNIYQPLVEFFQGTPRPIGYGLGNIATLERDQPDLPNAKALVTRRFQQIKATADKIGAKVIIVMVPASVQVCEPSQLAYYPQGVDLNDTTKFDMDLPQRDTKEIADSLGIPFYDLRPVLRAVPGGCPYQPNNMHWLSSGHRVVADYVAKIIVNDHLWTDRKSDNIKAFS